MSRRPSKPDKVKMLPGSVHPTSQSQTEAEYNVPGRPDFANLFVPDDRPVPATAVRAVSPERERGAPRQRPAVARVYMTAPSPTSDMRYFGRCFAYAYITPAEAACKANAGAAIRGAIHGALPDVPFELLGPGHGADKTVRFATPEGREAAMARQPFALEGGATVKLVREGETSNVKRIRLDHLALVALLHYPKEMRNKEDISRSCQSFGHLKEIDPECFAAPDLSPVRIVVLLEELRYIPHEVRIRYFADPRFGHVVPVQILKVWDRSESMDANGQYSQSQTEAESNVPGRPDFVDVFVSRNRPVPATAVRAVSPERERGAPRQRPDSVTVYLPAPSPDMWYFGECFAYAYITPAGAVRKANAGAAIRGAIHGTLPDVPFELLGPGHGADKTVRFATPEGREAAMARQPFALEGGAAVKLVREGETSNVTRIQLDHLALVALLHYPKELRNEDDIISSCQSFGHLEEIDPACFAAPDLSPVQIVVLVEHPRNIPHQIRIKYFDRRFRHVVPVQIVKVWDQSESMDANGQYIPMFSAAEAAAVPS
ncbi:hypothetical protein U9M48_034260 [Paspalum notatum var. saurae]|uniref:Uncharacterized protein n=1 Tax=Paspalum notatum var. saurae TaxID=547442 RepID=A0AAQ3UBV0_PASNO